MEADLKALEDQLDAAERDARALIAGLTEEIGARRLSENSWSVAECLEHLATTNRVYLDAMEGAAAEARKHGRMRRGPARPGWLGRLFIGSLEPPVKSFTKSKAPANIRPDSIALGDAARNFFASQDAVRTFLRANADLDLSGVVFPNPFVRGIKLSLATGLFAAAAHERRHLWQGWKVRRALESAHSVK
jgi:hypothetical protein